MHLDGELRKRRLLPKNPMDRHNGRDGRKGFTRGVPSCIVIKYVDATCRERDFLINGMGIEVN